VQELDDLEPAAKGVGQQLFVAWANDDPELDAALASFVQQRVGVPALWRSYWTSIYILRLQKLP